MDDPEEQGGFANIFKCECRGREVAVKVPRVSSQRLQDMTEVNHHWLVSSRSLEGRLMNNLYRDFTRKS